MTFDQTNWWMPFTVRLTSNPGAPATDPNQALQVFPANPNDRIYQTRSNTDDFDLVGGIRFSDDWFGWDGGPVWVDGHGWYSGQNWFDGDGFFNGYGGWFFDGDSWFDGHGNWVVDPEPSLHSLLCRPNMWHHGSWGGWGWGGGAWAWTSGFGCDDFPARMPIILPNEQGAGPAPIFLSVSHNLTIEATSPAGAVVSYNPANVHAEIGPATITYTQNSGTIFPIGTTTVGIYAIDEGGNYSSSSFTITVRDTTPPVITSVSPNLTAEATSPAGAAVTYAAATATDAVGPVTITYSKASGATFALGTTTVTVTATDAYGNHSSKTFTIKVQDTTPPVISAPNISVEATQSTGYKVGTSFPGISATDLVGVTSLTFSKSSGTILPFGTTTITATAKDAAGNTSTATFTVLVQDTTPPAITAPDVTVEATSASGAKVTYAPTATDAVGPVTLTISIPSGTTFALGTNPVTVTATDGHGNTSTKTFNVTVRDTTPPAITSVPANVTVEATSSAGATATYGTATATDAVSTPAITYSQASGTVFPIGVNVVTVTATDAAGNSSTKTFTVTVRDTTAPVITSVSGNLTAEATSAAGAVVTYAAATATDAVGPVTITYSKASGATFALGTTTVTVTATDAYGNHSSKTFTVTVKDTTPPVITASNMTVEATQSTGWRVGTFTATATDAVGPVTLTYSSAVGTVLPFGTTTVTVTAKDGAGNSSSATFTVLVQDTTAPVITAADVTVEATSASGAKVTYAPTATDAVGPVTLTISIASGTTFGLGTVPVTVTATDGHGNVATKTFNVTVRDTTPPALSVPANVTVEATSSAGATVTYAAATATDAVSTPTITYSQAAGTVFPLGSTTVTVTATDAAGNTTTKTFVVKVQDTTAPVITSVSGSFTVEATSSAGALVTYAAATATDAVSTPTITYSQASGTIFALGTTTVTVTATDAAGNHSSKTFTVTVKDTTPPVITASNMTVEATQSTGWKVGTFTATATDAVGPVTLTFSKSAGTILPFGTTTVTVTAKDGAGNTSTATFTVLVQDTTAPVITAADVTVEATGPTGAKATYAPTATDAVGPVTLTISIASGTTFALGTNSVTVTATDGHGNTAMKTFNVTVRDTTPPALTVSGNITVEATGPAGNTVTYSAAAATDAVSTPTITYSQASGTVFPVGSTTVTVTATDAAGNTTTKTFVVKVQDTTAPVIGSVSANLIAEATSAAGAVVNYTAATATDTVGPITYTYSKNSGATFAIGVTTVTVTATDAAGNHSSKTFTVTVKDTTAPVITAPNMTVEATQSGGWKVGTFAATATDAVGPVTLSYSKSVGQVLPFGTTSVTVTATDAYGNHSSATFTVLVQDTTAPVLAPLPNLVLEATSPAGAKGTFAPTATDAVGPVTITTSLPSGTIFPIGTTMVTVTATDGHGNSSTTSFTVTVQDTTPPLINAPLYLVVEATSLAGAVVTYPSFATDAVGPITYTYSIASGSLFPLSFSPLITMTATDAYGNTSTGSFTVFVHDSTPPVFTSISGNLTIEATSAAGAVVNYATPTATDALAPPIFKYSQSSGTTFAIGTTTVKVTAVDIVGNTTTKTFTITVRDTTPPAIVSVSPNLTIEATSSAGATVNYAAAVATDAVGPVTISYSKSSGSKFAIGTTTVTVTAKDAYGNTSTATFTVKVQDTTPPAIAPLTNLVLEATGPTGAKATFAPTATDAVGPVTITTSIASGTTFAIGTTMVTVTAKDAYGNTSTATFTVKVQDTTPPALTVSGNLTVQATGPAGAVVTYATATATDAVGPVTVTYSQASGTLFGFGVTTVTVTATDAHGNATTKTFTVKVQDTTPPTITSVSPNLTIEATSGAGAVVSYALATATDVVGLASITYSIASGSTFAIGTTTITVTATDVWGNVSTKTFTIKVQDTTPPVITSVSADVSVTTTSSSGIVVTYPAATATDNTGGPVTITYSQASGSKFAVGTTVVTVTATDAYGNKTTKTFKVIVVKH